MTARYIKTSAPSYVSGAAITMPEHFTDNIYSDGYNPSPIVLQSDEAPPVQVGLIPMDKIAQEPPATIEPSAETDDVGIGEEENENAVVIEDDVEEEEAAPVVEENLEGHGYPMRSPSLPNAVTIIPVGAGLAAEKGLISEDLPIIHDDTLPEAEIDNALDDSVPALLVPVEDVVMSNDGRLALNKRGGMIRAYGYRTGDGDIIYGDGLGNLFKKITGAVKNIGKKVVNVGKNIEKKL